LVAGAFRRRLVRLVLDYAGAGGISLSSPPLVGTYRR